MSTNTEAGGELVLVTGGAGFIGSHTVDRLIAHGHRVIVMDNLSSGRRENLAVWRDDPRVELVEASISDGLLAPLDPITERLGPVSRIIHLAAQVSVVYSMLNPLEDVRVNYQGTFHVLEYARLRAARRVVMASSSAIYSDDSEYPVAEEVHAGPISAYGTNKYASEVAMRFYSAAYGVPTTALRFFNVYGPRQDPSSSYSGVIYIFAARAGAGETLGIFGDGEQTRDFVYVSDVARALTRACFSKASGHAAYNIGTGVEISINELARKVIEIRGTGSEIQSLGDRPGDSRRSVADISLAAKELGFSAEVSLDAGLRETLEFI